MGGRGGRDPEEKGDWGGVVAVLEAAREGESRRGGVPERTEERETETQRGGRSYVWLLEWKPVVSGPGTSPLIGQGWPSVLGSCVSSKGFRGSRSGI